MVLNTYATSEGSGEPAHKAVSPEPSLFAHMKYGTHLKSFAGRRMSLRRTKSGIISRAGSFVFAGIGRRKNSKKIRFQYRNGERVFYLSPKISYVILVIESLDADTEIRRLGPIGIRVIVDGDSYLDILNEPEDHYWCSGYRCGRRLSTYFAPVPDIPGTLTALILGVLFFFKIIFFVLRVN